MVEVESDTGGREVLEGVEYTESKEIKGQAQRKI